MTLADRIESFAEQQSRAATVAWSRNPNSATWRQVMNTTLALRQVQRWLPQSPDHWTISSSSQHICGGSAT